MARPPRISQSALLLCNHCWTFVHDCSNPSKNYCLSISSHHPPPNLLTKKLSSSILTRHPETLSHIPRLSHSFILLQVYIFVDQLRSVLSHRNFIFESTMRNFLSFVKPLGQNYSYCLASYGYYHDKGAYGKKPKKRRLNKSFQKCVQQFSVFKDPSKINDLIVMIKVFQIEKKEKEESPLWRSFLKRGRRFRIVLRNFVLSESLDKGISFFTAEKLCDEGEALSIVGVLSMVASLLSQIDKMNENQSEIFELLRDMFYLAEHVKKFSDTIPKEKFISAIELIVRGSLSCASQLEAEKSISFAISPINLEALSSIGEKVNKLFSELFYPRHAVGIEDQVDEIVDLLKTTSESSVAVVIYGFGGTGKTTVAESVLAKINLHRYNCSKVAISQEEEKNNFKSLQQQILKDCFPTYNNGKPVQLTDCKDGRDRLVKASQFKKDKPIFLFIDNASSSLDLKELFPTCMSFLCPGSKILLTTRKLAATNMFHKLPRLVRKSYSVKPLAPEDALKILFRDPTKHGNFEMVYLDRILGIWRDVPLALEIVSPHLYKQTLGPLLVALESDHKIKEEKLTDRLVDFVYGELDESTQEAFLDICCFFSNWKRQDVEYIVGATAVKSLIRAGLITSIPNQEILYFKEDEEELIIHDIVVAKGRSLAKDNRIMDFQSLCEAADEERLDQIKGIWLANDKSNHVLQERHLSLMAKSLRVLALGDRMRFSKAKEMEFKELRFLRIGGSIPWLPLKLDALNNLKVFHGPFSIRGEVIMYKLPTSLLGMKVMEQSVDNESKTPEVEGVLQCHKLEKLHFRGSRELRKLVEASNNKLDALKTFILDDFTTMKELPQQICELPALSVLSITKTESLNSLPEYFGHLTTLKQLQLSYSLALKALPYTICQFEALTHLDLEGCCTLESIPPYFENLTALSHLNLSECKSLETLAPGFGYLKGLKYLNLACCEKLQVLPPSFKYLSALKHLCLRQCIMLQTLPLHFGELAALEYLCLRQCTMLQDLPLSFGCLSSLEYLCLRECTMLNTLPDNFGQLKALEYLSLYQCKSLTISSPVLEELTALKCLECSREEEVKIKGQVKEEVIVAY